MDKSPDAFRTISEVAEHLETPAHVLRFWESRFPQIRPVKRAGGRRYYRPSDVSLLTGIKRLLHDEGMTIRGVQKILREQGVRHVSGLAGDAIDDEHDVTASFVDLTEDHVAQVVVPMRAEPPMSRPVPAIAPGLAAAMAKAEAAPSTALPETEPAQGALLLTPLPPSVTPQDVEVTSETSVPDTPIGESPTENVQDDAAGDDRSASQQSAFPETTVSADDFEEDDFDDGPVTTLAARIRTLPSEASAVQVGRELLGVVARLQALRDRMAEAAQPSRF